MTVVITGATRGIGAGLAAAYRDQGKTVIGTGRSGADVVLDVTEPDAFAALSTAVGTDPVDLLVCNAGIYCDKGHSIGQGYSAQDWADTFAVNVTGVYLTVEALLPQLRASKGKIAIISSQMAARDRAKGSSLIYRASKMAVLNLGWNLAAALKSDGIAVGIYHPGWVQTDMGGMQADITVDASVQGLVAEFDALDLGRTGCFRTWDGRDHTY